MKKIGSLLLVLFFPLALCASTVTFTASLDKYTVRVGEAFTYKVTISGSDLGKPTIQVPNIQQHFQFRSQSRQRSMSSFNGVSSVSQSFHYIFVPIKEGSYVIPPSVTNINGQRFRTGEVRLKVVVASVAPVVKPKSVNKAQKPAARIFAHTQLSKKTVYVGEEIVFDLSLYRRARLWSNISYEVPEFTGFWAEDLTVKKDQKVKMVDNRNYYVQELVRKSLFPIKEGRYKVSSSKISFVVHPLDGERVVQSDVQDVRVLPLPSNGRPSSFKGLVGRFDLSLNNAFPRVATQNVPFSLSFSLSGEGGLTRVSDIYFEPNEDFKIYRSKISDHVSFTKGVRGRRDFEYIIVPRVSGQSMVPTFTVTYFSPESKSYQSKYISGQKLRIQPSGQSDMVFSDSQGTVAVSRDLRYLHMPMNIEEEVLFFWDNKVLRLFFYSLLFGGFVFVFGFFRHRFLYTNGMNKRSGQAYSRAFKSLKAMDRNKDTLDVVSDLQQLVYQFLSDRSGVLVQGFTGAELAALLREKGVSVDIVSKTGDVLDSLSQLIYSGAKIANVDTLFLAVGGLLKLYKSRAKGF